MRARAHFGYRIPDTAVPGFSCVGEGSYTVQSLSVLIMSSLSYRSQSSYNSAARPWSLLVAFVAMLCIDNTLYYPGKKNVLSDESADFDRKKIYLFFVYIIFSLLHV